MGLTFETSRKANERTNKREKKCAAEPKRNKKEKNNEKAKVYVIGWAEKFNFSVFLTAKCHD